MHHSYHHNNYYLYRAFYSKLIFSIIIVICSIPSTTAGRLSKCRDTDMNCPIWLAGNGSVCQNDAIIQENCKRSCELCGGMPIDPRYDVRLLPPSLKEVAWMVGRWRNEFGGKAFFPTIPKFSYGEQIDITLADNALNSSSSSLNYTAFAWDINMPEGDPIEIHSENGYITTKRDEKENKTLVSFTTAMSNGFMTVEEGEAGPNQIRFRLERIGRISFSHDSAVIFMFREWTLLDENQLEARLLMATTVTRRLQEHTYIIYKKIYP